MATKIRLARFGRHKRPFYRIVAIDSQAPRNGRALEVLGQYDPLAYPKNFSVKQDRVQNWIRRGAQMSDTVRQLLKQAGLLRTAEPR